MDSIAFEQESLQGLYDQGLYLRAYQRMREAIDARAFATVEEQLLAGRIVRHLGAPRLADYFHFQAYRRDRTHPLACYCRARAMLERRGPYAAWQIIRRLDARIQRGSAEVRAEWLAFQGLVAGIYRDFSTAEQLHAQAEAVSPQTPWIWVEKAATLEMADRYADALDAAEHILQLQPWFRAGVESKAHLLTLMGRDDEALALLCEGAQRTESLMMHFHLAMLQKELGRYEDAWETLSRCDALAPLAEKEVNGWLTSMKSDIAYDRGDREQSMAFAASSDVPFFRLLLTKMEAAPPAAKRVHLPVEFIRQHHMTCAPATLTAIGQFWGQPVDHLHIAEQICYDGTPWHNERRWAEENGWTTREFTITLESAKAMLDRGVPFTLTLTDVQNGHLQAVIGYDECRGTLLIRDPYVRNVIEAHIPELFTSQRATGPRGMALVPNAHAKKLTGFTLPDEELWNALYTLNLALTRHQRREAAEVLAQMMQSAPDHIITLHARMALARYDDDIAGSLGAVDAFLAHFPNDANMLMARLSCLRQLARRDERMQLLQQLCAQRKKKAESEATEMRGERPPSFVYFLQPYAQELSADAREHPRAINLLQRALRYAPTNADNYFTYANILWDQQQYVQAWELLRLALCLDEKNEQFAAMFFNTSRYLQRTDEALAFLRERYARFGKLSYQPVRTLIAALQQLNRTDESFALLEEAAKLRPDDGELLLFAADFHAQYGRFKQAEALLTRAKSNSNHADWLRAAAGIAVRHGELQAALALWREVLKTESLAMDAHSSVAQLLAETEGYAATLQYFETVTTRFPHYFPLHQTWAEWLKNADDLAGLERVLRRMLDTNPVESWTRRELAGTLMQLQRLDEALAEIELANQIEPGNTSTFSIYGEIYGKANRWSEAKAAYREAIRLSVDNTHALGKLVSSCDTVAERREALLFVLGELERQPIYGDSLLAFRHYAKSTLPPAELTSFMQRALDARSDLWQAWSAMIDQLRETGEFYQALTLARTATEQFPFQVVLWNDQALVCRMMGDVAGERAALEQALQIMPGYSQAIRNLAESYERAGDFAQATTILEEAVAHNPLEAGIQCDLISLYWNYGDKTKALERLRILLRIEPTNNWAWERYCNACQELGQMRELEDAVRAFTRKRPGSTQAWLTLARALTAPEHLQERLAACKRAIALDARCYEAYERQALLLAKAGRYQEALQACTLPGGRKTPSRLRHCAARIEIERGQPERAIALTKEIVADDPGYYDGWILLAKWYDDQGKTDEYAEVTGRLIRLNPQDALAFGYHGDAMTRLKKPAEAKQAFQRALELDPSYLYAGVSLLNLQTTDREYDAAAGTLAIIGPHMEPARRCQYAIRLYVKKGDEATAFQYLRELCAQQGEEAIEALSAVTDLMLEVGWAPRAEILFSEFLDKPEANPEVGASWVECRVKRNEYANDATIDRLLSKGLEAGSLAAARHLWYLGQVRRHQQAKRFIRERQALLRQHDMTWGMVGQYYMQTGEAQGALEWTADWEKRRDVKPWMLMSRAVVLRSQGDDLAAMKLHRKALTMPHDQSLPHHAVWAAFAAAEAGHVDEGLHFLYLAQQGELSDYLRFIAGLAHAVLVFQQAKANPATAFNLARASLRALHSSNRLTLPVRRSDVHSRYYYRTILLLTQGANNAAAWLWFAGQIIRLTLVFILFPKLG